MKVGDSVYIVSAGKVPVWAEVVYVGAFCFMTGDYTFHRAKEGEPFVGIHSRGSRAYASLAAYNEWREKCDAWNKLRYSVGLETTPPDHLNAAQITAFIELLKRKPDAT